ncbi:hypothetical protein CERZMDRAFT_71583 [Cercospora zeae-maydis SCOH1-5]|uniref:DNA-directed RNA polymerase subunit n=1 Tax=Cercospora zeae-maydis SCOH1-5 TaxID=717836 RepID=A0A6A6F1B6_9PEZI|nr:hypothetical protein CERZMDRAFT_71583 [Cercospora zeae-maydis SCOH1-5]
MALVGGLCFCFTCGNLLERVSPSRSEIQCDVCGTTNQNNWPHSKTETSRASTFPSTLRTRLHSAIQEVSEEQLKKGQRVEQECEKCSAPEMYFTELQLRSADEGTTIFYSCRKCGHRYKENN